MKRRQTSIPRQWLIADERGAGQLRQALSRLPRGSGVLVLRGELSAGRRVRLLGELRRSARRRGLVVVEERRERSKRVHSMRELRQAGSADAPLIFLSPLFRTRTHPDWKPLPRMRAASLARLAPMPVIALGGMDSQKFRQLERLGFQGWAGIDAWLF